VLGVWGVVGGGWCFEIVFYIGFCLWVYER